MSEGLSNLEELLNRIQEADGDGDEVTIDDILDKVGRRSFAPLLLLAGIITLAPVVGDIPDYSPRNFFFWYLNFGLLCILMMSNSINNLK